MGHARRARNCVVRVDLLDCGRARSPATAPYRPNLAQQTPETAALVEHFRRTDPRYDRRVEVEIRAGSKQITAKSRNLSLGGMFAETEEPLPVQTPVEIRFRIPTQPEPVDVAGEVRWIEAAKPGVPGGMGIRFQGLRARDVWALNRFFQS